jgi:hypothetical protein
MFLGRGSKKNLDTPDERIQLEGMHADIVQLGDASISRNVFQPGAIVPSVAADWWATTEPRKAARPTTPGLSFSGCFELRRTTAPRWTSARTRSSTSHRDMMGGW